MSVFDLLPKDILVLIGLKLDCRDLGALGMVTRKFHQSFMISNEFTEVLRIKSHQITRLNLSHYTRGQLEFLCRMRHGRHILAAGAQHSLVLTSRNQVYSFGSGANGRLGLGNKKGQFTPMLIENLVGKITAISAGGYHSLILNSQDQVFSFGGNDCGQLGTRDKKGKLVPTLITNSKIGKITAISAGGNHSLILNSEGQVFSFGANDHGKLGLGNWDKEKLNPTLITYSLIGQIEPPESARVIAISAGSDHSLLLNDQGQVFSFGKGEYGRTGLGDEYDRSIPISIKGLTEEKVVAISAGADHSLFLAAQGQVFSCGFNADGRLGLGHKRNQFVPTLIEAPWVGEVVAISAGGFHSILLNSQGQIYLFGSKNLGPSILGVKGNFKIPTLIESPELGEVMAISAGGGHNLVCNSQGQIFGFGDNNFGRLGLGKKVIIAPDPVWIENLVI
jgi:alpha-tubulin suppressor-like RCC1 family protein